jgi:hypothetical protein
MPTAFVLMPFDEEFDPIFSDFIRPSLESGGFDVKRASDIESQQNILRDIVNAIETYDVIVADLTGSNPNVFYELGVAHGRLRPVILLTQSVEEVPFDLKTYRLIPYSRDFAEMGKAKAQLSAYAGKLREGTLPVGNPVSDYLGEAVGAPLGGTGSPVSEDAGDDGDNAEEGLENVGEHGFLDHAAALQGGYTRLAEVLVGISGHTNNFGDDINEATANLQSAASNPNSSYLAYARSVCRKLAERVAFYRGHLKPANDEFSEIMDDMGDSLEILAAFQLENIDGTEPQIQEYREQLQLYAQSATEMYDALGELVTTIEATPKAERRLNRELALAVAEMRRMRNNTERSISSVQRALSRLDQVPSGPAI